jgi:cell division protein FtsL
VSALRKEVIYDYGQESEVISQKKKRIKSKKKNRIVIDSFKTTAMLTITFLLGIIIIYNYAIITDKKMELNLINAEIVKLKNDVDDYSVALESINNSNKIVEMAKNYLGMNYPTRKQTVFLDFAYGEDNIEEETVIITEENNNLLYGLIDKVIGFIQ